MNVFIGMLTWSVCVYSVLLFLKFISGVHVLVFGRRDLSLTP